MKIRKVLKLSSFPVLDTVFLVVMTETVSQYDRKQAIVIVAVFVFRIYIWSLIVNLLSLRASSVKFFNTKLLMLQTQLYIYRA